MDTLLQLADPKYVARFQQFCGVELIKPGTCDQQTQTKRQNSFDEGQISNGCVDAASSNGGPSSHHQHQANGDIRNGNTGVNKRLRNKSGDVKECNNNGDASASSCGVDESCNGSGPFSLDGHSCSSTTTHSDPGASGENETEYFKGFASKNGVPGQHDTTVSKEMHKKMNPAYRIKYKALLYLAHFGAILGNEEWYLTFFPFCVWNLDSLVVRQISLLWGLIMYLGQATKDYLRWPRPPCPPVVRLEFSYLQEFSMPSTHAMAGTAIPLYMAQLIMDRYQVPLPIVAGLAIFWFTTTCYSRLYLGVHSILDLLAGFVFALSLYITFIRYIEDYDLYQQTHRFAPVMVVVTALMLCTVCYPSQHKISSKGDAVQIVAAVAGFSVGFWLHFQLGYTHMPTELKPYSIPFPTLHCIFLCVLRFISGLIVLGVSYLILKPSSIRFFSYLYGLEFPDKTNTNVVTGYKFTTYFSLGIIISFFIPLLHVWLGIPRDSFFNEVV